MSNEVKSSSAGKKAKTEEKTKTPAPINYWLPDKNFALIGILTLITVFLLILAFAPSLRSYFQKKAVINPTPPILVSPAHTTLSITPPATSLLAWNSNVVISTGINKVTAIQLNITYNPQEISNVDIAAGTFFSNPAILLKKIDPKLGEITYVLGIGLGQKAVSGNGTVATITFTPNVNTKQSSFAFAPETGVAAQGELGNVLKSSAGINFKTK